MRKYSKSLRLIRGVILIIASIFGFVAIYTQRGNAGLSKIGKGQHIIHEEYSNRKLKV